MQKFHVSFTDRKKLFSVIGLDHHDAVMKAAGNRLYSASYDHRQENKHGQIEKWVYRCNIRNGRTIRGSTPVYQARAYVYPV